jgi:hypothetical protein
MDNSKGYTDENTHSCCGDCNYLKRDYAYDNLMAKCHLIYEYQKVHPMVEHNMKGTKNIVTGNKLTAGEKIENGIIRKKMQQEDLFEKYTSEFARKEWINSIVQKRKERS